ncbi:hypothetical protein BB561_004092 [Smittium simulii]|uniref:Peptidase S1 domain-containing protein n=1 Tax=Smittium simulii TaxID=133385 RepID=A0A2T9YI18_9FUNG|nr:hypothetical protein BB561_004092 [Smittium simulii]
MYAINTKLMILTFLSLSKASILNNILTSITNLNDISSALPETSPISSSSSTAYSFSKRIVNGKAASISEFPYVGSISVGFGLLERTSGWGTTTKDISKIESQTYSSTLNSIEISITSQKKCEDPSEKILGSSEGSICSANKNDQGICLGDLGNPLATLDNGIHKLVGVASRIVMRVDTSNPLLSKKLVCGKSGDGATFTHLYHYIDWINENIEKLGGNSISLNQNNNSSNSNNSSSSGSKLHYSLLPISAMLSLFILSIAFC